MDAGKALRVLQVALVLGAVLTGLGWFEEERSTTRELGKETLHVRTAAPVENPRGPWTEEDTFTDAQAGVPPDVAPTLTITVDHRTDGLPVEDRSWNATLRFEATGDDGGTWWRESRPLAIDADGETGRLSLDLADTVNEARSLADEADVPSRLSIRIDVRQAATVTVDGDPRPSEHTASVELVPREGFVVVQTQEGGSTYSRPVETGVDPLPGILLAGAVLAEIGVRLVRRGDAPWEHVRGVRVVQVDDLRAPADSHRVAFDALAGVARDENEPLLVDPAAGLAVLAGDRALTADLPGQR